MNHLVNFIKIFRRETSFVTKKWHFPELFQFSINLQAGIVSLIRDLWITPNESEGEDRAGRR